MHNLIKEKLTEYLNFDSDLLFKDVDYLVVFGGSIRDIIADKSSKNITDIDILCLPKSRQIIVNRIVKNGYKYVDLQRPDLYQIYKDIKYIFEPKTYIKNDKVIQFITPSIYNINDPYDKKNIFKSHKDSFFGILSNVDIITSGVFYDGKNLYESIKNSVYYIKSKKYCKVEGAFMYSNDRYFKRQYLLEKKGYSEINGDYKMINRIAFIDKQLKNKYLQLYDYEMYIQKNEMYIQKNEIF